MENPHPFATRKKKELIKDKKAYIDSVAKGDFAAFNRLLASPNDRRAVRLYIGASEAIPTRALGYLAAAARVAEMIDAAQLQVVSVANLGVRVNGVDKDRVRQQFEMFARVGRHMLSHALPGIKDQTVFAEDTEEAIDAILSLTPATERVLSNNPGLRDKLALRGHKHGGDFAFYTAAHVAYQDIGKLSLHRLSGPEIIESDGVVAVGCLQEKLFFEARQRVRDSLGEAVVPSVQAFSLHVSAPYFVANGGEQLLNEAAVTRQLELTSTVPSTHRDLQHLQLFLGEAHHEQ